MASHGDIPEVTFNHPTLGTGVFYPIAGEGHTFDPGGLRNNDDSNAIAGNGDPVFSKSRVRGFLSVLVENDMLVREDAIKVAALAADPLPAEYTFSVINGAVWSGTGAPVGDIAPDIMAGTFTLKIDVSTWEKQ